MNQTKIEWCDVTINPVIGCRLGCEYCYARKINKRFSFTKDFSKPEFFPERIKQFYSKKPKRVFVDSMSDVADWDFEDAMKVAIAIKDNPQHRFLYLTKRPHSAFYKVPDRKNVWFGASVTTEHNLPTLIDLMVCNHQNTFVSIEPIHGDVAKALQIIRPFCSWIIVGAETGNRSGKIIPEREWIDNIVEWSNRHGIAVFMKESLLPVMGEEGMLRSYPSGLNLEMKGGTLNV